MLKGYVHDITPTFRNEFHELIYCPIGNMEINIVMCKKHVAPESDWLETCIVNVTDI
jgi:hypothetical protein